MLILRALVALAVPIILVLLVPFWLLQSFPGSAPSFVFQVPGALPFTSGLVLAGWCMLLFFNVGRGTIMPWDPTRKLVAVGPYQYIRNPMISGVITMLAGAALFFGAVAIAMLAVVFFLINHAYFIYSEELGLEKRFGDDYKEYKRNVPRWIPRHPSRQKIN